MEMSIYFASVFIVTSNDAALSKDDGAFSKENK